MKFTKTIVAFLFMAIAGILSLNAQNRTLSGKVLDSQQQPVIGAAVMVKEANSIGSVTGSDGTFSMNIPSGNVTLEVSCLGYMTKDVTVPATQSMLTITLEDDTMMLEETVVVGYGTQKKVNLTGAVT